MLNSILVLFLLLVFYMPAFCSDNCLTPTCNERASASKDPNTKEGENLSRVFLEWVQEEVREKRVDDRRLSTACEGLVTNRVQILLRS